MAADYTIRRYTTAEWRSIKPVLANGEYGYDTDLREFRRGDGRRIWDQLDVVSTRLRTVTLSASNGSDGSALATGAVKGANAYVDFEGLIYSWEAVGSPISGQTVGTCVLDVIRTSSGTPGFPGASNSIAGTAKPGITSALQANSSTLTDWNNALHTGDKLGLDIESVSNFYAVLLVLKVAELL